MNLVNSDNRELTFLTCMEFELLHKKIMIAKSISASAKIKYKQTLHVLSVLKTLIFSAGDSLSCY